MSSILNRFHGIRCEQYDVDMCSPSSRGVRLVDALAGIRLVISDFDGVMTEQRYVDDEGVVLLARRRARVRPPARRRHRDGGRRPNATRSCPPRARKLAIEVVQDCPDKAAESGASWLPRDSRVTLYMPDCTSTKFGDCGKAHWSAATRKGRRRYNPLPHRRRHVRAAAGRTRGNILSLLRFSCPRKFAQSRNSASSSGSSTACPAASSARLSSRISGAHRPADPARPAGDARGHEIHRAVDPAGGDLLGSRLSTDMLRSWATRSGRWAAIRTL